MSCVTSCVGIDAFLIGGSIASGAINYKAAKINLEASQNPEERIVTKCDWYKRVELDDASLANMTDRDLLQLVRNNDAYDEACTDEDTLQQDPKED